MAGIQEKPRLITILGALQRYSRLARNDKARRKTDITINLREVLVLPLSLEHQLYLKSAGDKNTGYLGKFNKVGLASHVGTLLIVRNIRFANEVSGHADWRKAKNDELLLRPFDIHGREIEPRVVLVAPLADLIRPENDTINPIFKPSPTASTAAAKHFFVTRAVTGGEPHLEVPPVRIKH